MHEQHGCDAAYVPPALCRKLAYPVPIISAAPKEFLGSSGHWRRSLLIPILRVNTKSRNHWDVRRDPARSWLKAGNISALICAAPPAEAST
jgi:hypothetical protein